MDWFGDTFFIISTHAPLAGRDVAIFGNVFGMIVFQPTRPLRGATFFFHLKEVYLRISTHAPLAGRDVFPFVVCAMLSQFQPTRPLRGATGHWL